MPELCFIVESGCDVRLVEELASRFPLRILARRIAGGVEISRVPRVPVDIHVGPASRLAFALLAFRTVWAERDRDCFVLVQGYGAAALAANIAARLGGLPSRMLVCSPVEAYYRCRHPRGGPALSLLSVLARVNARIGAGYIVLSEYLAQVVRAHGTRLPVDRIPLYGVDTTRFSPTLETRASVRRALNLRTEGKLLFFSSRVAPEKDSATLLRALKHLHDRAHDVTIVHRSGNWREFVRLAEACGVSQHVDAADALAPGDNLAQHYRASDLCVQASREEGLGFSVLEALACGTPVVAAAVGGLRETIREPQTGWTYEPGNAEALADAIERALSDPAEAARRAARGRAMVQSTFESKLVFDAFENLVRAQTTSAVAERAEASNA